MSVKCVVFDAVGTLFYPASPIAHTYSIVGSRFGSKLARADVEQLFWPAFHKANSSRSSLATDESTERSFWSHVVSSVFHDVSTRRQAQIFNVLWNHFGEGNAWTLFNDVVPVLEYLHSHELPVAIGSNFDRRLHRVCRELSIDTLVDVVFDSASVGFCKPHGTFFLHLQNAFGFDSNCMVMVGDDIETDIHGAKNAGWNAIHVDRSPDPSTSVIEDDETSCLAIKSLTESIDVLAAMP